MAAILIAAHDGPYYTGSSTTLTLRVYSQNDTWTTREGVTVQQGDGINPWYRDYSCPVTAGIPAIPDLHIYSTVDRIEQYLDPQWAAIWLDNGVNIGFYFQGYRVPPTPTTTSKVALDIFTAATNNNRPIVNAPITVADAMALFFQGAGLTPGFAPKVVADYPAQFADSVYGESGGDALLNCDRVYLDAVSGGMVLAYGVLGYNAGIVTNLPFGGISQTIFTNTNHAAIVDNVIFYHTSTDLSGWSESTFLGSDSFDDWSNGTLKMSQLNLVSAANVGYIGPDQGAKIVPAGRAFNVFWNVGTNPGTLTALALGHWLILP